MKIIMKSIFGSHLYGTNTPSSDHDFKGIYLPSKDECYLNQIVKSKRHSTGPQGTKNSAEDVDEEIYSIQYFIKLAIKGEMIVIDMLHTPDHQVIEKIHLWERIRSCRGMFYSKNLAGYLGYIRKQTAKYGIKGSRLAAMEGVLNIFNSHDETLKIADIKKELPTDEYCMFTIKPQEKRWEFYEVCGRLLQESITIKEGKSVIQRIYDRYGERAQAAKDNKGIDWKAISHAFRAGYQLMEIYETGDLVYPLKDAKFLKALKCGLYHYQNDSIGEQLEDMLANVEDLAKNSEYPSEISEEFMNNMILGFYSESSTDAI